MHKQILLNILKELHTGAVYPHQGICGNVQNMTNEMGLGTAHRVNNLMDSMFDRWPEYSGNPKYPVPHPAKESSQGYWSVISDHRNDRTKPDLWHGEYGESRRRLLNWMISELEAS